jgi:hypothetical protein
MTARVFTVALLAAALSSPVAAGPRTRVLKVWQDTVKMDGKDVPRRYEIVFDYGEGVARIHTYDEKDTLLDAKAMTSGQPRPSDEEIAEAFGLVRTDPLLGRIVGRTKAIPEGGFLLEEGEGRACGPRSRCLHTLWLSPDRRGLIRWVVVDLVRQAVVYPSYTPPDGATIREGVAK